MEALGNGEDCKGRLKLDALPPLLHFARLLEEFKQQQRLNSLWKVQHLINELNKQAKDMWVPGVFVAIDEQTIGFQGQLGMKLRISYKQEGDGYQCDAVCDSRYTFSFYFCHGPLPDLDDKFKQMDLFPTA